MEKDLVREDLRRNNLDRSSSPYLLQHVSNPVWWQEWSTDIISYALSSATPVLVSVGYATCHWCHVMASEAFSDASTAKFLNENFICIKVDREQRPDIDQYMMDFINSQNGRGGWPLNVFLTPSLKPVFAMTYAPPVNRNSAYSFLEIAEQVYGFIRKNDEEIPVFSPDSGNPDIADEETLVKSLLSYYDPVDGGFGSGQKFPAHCTILFLLYNLSVKDNKAATEICVKTLDAMRMRGLADHLQGGIYRYCVDSEWTIPHFEKMLYDQALALWTYSLAYRVTGRDVYRAMAFKIVKCLEESFENEGLYITAHDADTDHKEGVTYLWSRDQLLKELGSENFKRFSEVYQITEKGNFEGTNHLIRKNDTPLDDLEELLLGIRKNRMQPMADDKILSGLNALLAASFIVAGRYLDEPGLVDRGSMIVKKIVGMFWDGRTLGHSFRQGKLQRQGFLSDAASLLTAISLLYEDDPSLEKTMTEIAEYVKSFREGDRWIESRADDFKPVFASMFDHPVPSGVSMALFGLTRFSLLKGIDTTAIDYIQPYQSDFYNIAAMMNNGLFHVITSPSPLPWGQLPVNSLQVRGSHSQDCYMGTCTIPDTTYPS